MKKNEIWDNSHYNNVLKLSLKDIERGEVKLDPYTVAMVWKTGSRDNSGILIHQLKTIARFGDKNEVKREIKAIYEQAKRMCEIYEVDINN